MAAAARQDSAEQSGSEAGWEMVKDSQSWGQPGAGLRGPGSTGNGRWEQLRASGGRRKEPTYVDSSHPELCLHGPHACPSHSASQSLGDPGPQAHLILRHSSD